MAVTMTPCSGGTEMMWYAHNGTWWWVMALTATIFWLAVLAAVAAFVVWVVRGWGRSPASPSTPSSARAILEGRLARGEIGHEEFQQRLRVLGDEQRR